MTVQVGSLEWRELEIYTNCYRLQIEYHVDS